MNKKDFDKLPKEDRELVFEEMCKLYSLIEKYSITLEDLEMFAEWATFLGCFGEDLENKLNGFYPAKWLNEGVDITKIYLNSLEARKFVNWWHALVWQKYLSKNND